MGHFDFRNRTMSKYLLFDVGGRLEARYDSTFNRFIPPEAMPVSDELFAETMQSTLGSWRLIGDAVVHVTDTQSPAELIASAHARINAAYIAAVNALTAGYPETEIASWPKQEAEARALVADGEAVTPWIDAAATARGITREAFAALILANADLFAPAHAALTGHRQALRDAIDALGSEPTKEQLDEIQW